MLDDFPLGKDLAFPISPVNSISDSLGSLHKPTPSKLEFTWSSGDIPVILYDNAYLDERVSGLFISGDNKRESVVTLVDDSNHRFSQRFSRPTSIDRHRDSVIISSSVSSDTLRSTATFGTRNQPVSSNIETRRSSFSYPSQAAGEQPPWQTSESTIIDDSATGEAVLDDTCLPQSNILHYHSDAVATSRGNDNQSLNIGEWYSFSSIERAGTSSGENTYVEPPSSTTRASILLEDCDDGDIRRSPSVQTWFSLSEWDYNDHTTLEPSSESLKRTSQAFRDVLPAGGSTETTEIMSPLPPHIPKTIQDHHEALSPFERLSDSAMYRSDTFLRATSVQFLIDQEGFRDAEPSFKFCGISPVRSSEEIRSQDRIMAQFRPVSRQQFHFHHAPFETPPVLRRITVNNDDASDYVSRQAHLTLKSNGVYVIRGHEALSAQHTSEQTKLYWQFEYLVDDRRVESSRRDLEGEKTFTPLTFSCSPRLLLPSQAKRINIMHVFKKSLAPKLVAEKLQVRLGTHWSGSNPASEKNFSLKAPHSRSSRSHDRRSRGAGDDAPSKRAVSTHVLIGTDFERQNAYGTDGGQTTSFAQEPQPLSRYSTHIFLQPEPVAKGDDQNPNTGFIDHSSSFLHGPSALDRHIVPPARLSELLIQDSPATKGHAPGSSSWTSFLDTSERDGKTFVALSPRPKRPTSMKI